jgi:hypothetical protein
MRAMYAYHTQSRGWCDIGYNFVVAANGTIFEGRWARRYLPWETHDAENGSGKAVAGAHVADFNSGSVGISLMGNYMKTNLPNVAKQSLVNLLAWEADRHGLDPRARHVYENPDSGHKKRLPMIAGHRDAGSTSCPGDRVYDFLPTLRKRVAVHLDPSKKTSRLSLGPRVQEAKFQEPLTVSGVLKDEDGGVLAGRDLRIYSFRPGRHWRLRAELVTGADGTYSFGFEPGSNLTFVSDYEGDPTTWDRVSHKAKVVVHPKLTFDAVGGTREIDGTVHYPADTDAVDFAGGLEPAHPGLEVRVRIFRMKGNGDMVFLRKKHPEVDEDGNIAVRYRKAVPGPLYRVKAVFEGDSDHGRGGAPPVFFQLDE